MAGERRPVYSGRLPIPVPRSPRHHAPRALVTGGAGFIGSHLVGALLDADYEVHVVDDLSSGRAERVGGGAQLERIDVRDGVALTALAHRVRPEVVFHLAAQVDVGVSVREPALDLRVNVEGTINALEAARVAGARRFVLASTGGAIYGDGQTLPMGEEAETAPLSPYGQSKLAAEGYCTLYARLHAVSPISLRFANVYGPGQEVRGEGAVVAAFTGRMGEGERPRVFGDGGQTRDFVFVEDVVRAMLLAAASGEPGILNVGTGTETSVLELGRRVAELCGAPFDPEYAPARTGEVRRSALNPERATAMLGWVPEVSLDEGLGRTLGGGTEASNERRQGIAAQQAQSASPPPGQTM